MLSNPHATGCRNTTSDLLSEPRLSCLIPTVAIAAEATVELPARCAPSEECDLAEWKKCVDEGCVDRTCCKMGANCCALDQLAECCSR